MRILGVSKKWDKLNNPGFTTFRFERKDKDWHTGELIRVVYKPRSKEREILGLAKIIDKELRKFAPVGYSHPLMVTDSEAILDGFNSYHAMFYWFYNQYGNRIFDEPVNKLTLRWVNEEAR